ncbi:trypsin-7-like isoform X2 [Nylanderia fulva]|uniref:trypsin-7-like isoform X2 n=1 Tax=Nylanderia fulva TaxID=613905 RepID=UPI0010FAE43B|nr:trypsin-7-like isoform X2 [Nylanderia fulva]
MNARFQMLNFLYFAQERIIGGSDISIESVPYVLSLMLNGEYACSASIINNKWAITAAHCVTAVLNPLKEISVCSGSSILYENCIIHNVTDFYIHEDYNSIINDYDIAVIKVTPSFAYNSFTKPVGLAPYNAENVFKEWGVVCGWGYYLKCDDEIDPFVAKMLKCIEIPKIERNLCYEDYKFRSEITNQMICYGYQDGAQDACQGDSGGALVNKDNILLGITSWGDGCGKLYSPGIYTDAVALRHWIKNKIDMNT